MKKILTLLAILTFTTLGALAGDKEDVMEVFDKYVKAANNYSVELPNYYVNNAKILRVVNKKSGGKHTVVIPFDRYLKELDSNSKLAKLVNYKNRYEDRKIEKVGSDYKITATRIPRNDKTGLECHFIFTKVSGKWKIKEESMTTNVQTFLTAK